MGIDFENLARMAAARLSEELSAPEKDTKRARDLSAILKDMLALKRETRSMEDRQLTVEFIGSAEEDSM